jgi:hypothetical protein
MFLSLSSPTFALYLEKPVEKLQKSKHSCGPIQIYGSEVLAEPSEGARCC